MTKDPFERYNTKPEFFLKGESEPESLQRINARIESARRGDPKVPLLRWLTIGAAAILLAVLINDVFMKTEAPVMAESFFEPLPNYVTTQTRGGAMNEDETYDLYDMKDYQAFIGQLKASDRLKAVDSLYLGVSYLALKDWPAAIGHMKDLNQSLPKEFVPSQQWYLALAFLGHDQVSEALILLEDIRSGNSPNATNAEALYDALR